MENFAGSRKVAHILKVWSLLSTKIPVLTKSVMNHSPAIVEYKYFFQNGNSNLAVKFDKFCVFIFYSCFYFIS
jgi:hypothetical protein